MARQKYGQILYNSAKNALSQAKTQPRKQNHKHNHTKSHTNTKIKLKEWFKIVGFKRIIKGLNS